MRWTLLNTLNITPCFFWIEPFYARNKQLSNILSVLLENFGTCPAQSAISITPAALCNHAVIMLINGVYSIVAPFPKTASSNASNSFNNWLSILLLIVVWFVSRRGSVTSRLDKGLHQLGRCVAPSIKILSLGHSLNECGRSLLRMELATCPSIVAAPSFPGTVAMSWDWTKFCGFSTTRH